MTLVAALRADLHNTSAREFSKHFKLADFMPEAKDEGLEARVQELIKMGYPPAAACAIATRKQSKEHQLHLINAVTGAAAAKAAQAAGPGRRSAVPVLKKRA